MYYSFNCNKYSNIKFVHKQNILNTYKKQTLLRPVQHKPKFANTCVINHKGLQLK